jgi:hypothetical protein
MFTTEVVVEEFGCHIREQEPLRGSLDGNANVITLLPGPVLSALSPFCHFLVSGS